MNIFGVVFDAEFDGLQPTLVHVMSATVDGENIGSTPDHGKMSQLLVEHDVLVGHNICRFDLPHLERILDIKIPKETLIVDTLALSWYLSPDRQKHGLESYGEDYGVPKPKIDDWHNLDYPAYEHRCREDVKINVRLWNQQYQHLREIYGSHEDVERFLRYLAFKMDCAREQERSRWKLDEDRCKESLKKLERLKEEKFEELRTSMPRVPITATRIKPQRCIKGDGTPSVSGAKWQNLLRSMGLPDEYDEPLEVITGYDEPNPGSHDQIKQWLYSLGWVPRTFKTNKKKQEVPQINKAKQDGGGVCESVLELADKDPAINTLDNLFVLGHRISILNGFLNSVSDDGYVVARIQGLTNTLRVKHQEVVNLPKIDAAFGEDIRGALIAPEGYELCGSDLSSLEDRLKQSFMYPYDPGYVDEMNVPGFDPHNSLAVSAGVMTKKESEFYTWYSSQDDDFEPTREQSAEFKRLKTIRSIFKNGNYACQYGAYPPKIAKTTGIPMEQAQQVFDAYWNQNWSIKKIAEAQKVKTVRGSMWLYNPISRFWYSLRNERDRFSTLVQGSGVFCFDTWLAVIRRDRPQLTGSYHDEVILCVKKGHREQITDWLKGTIEETNNILQLNRRLDIEVQYGNRYSEIH